MSSRKGLNFLMEQVRGNTLNKPLIIVTQFYSSSVANAGLCQLTTVLSVSLHFHLELIISRHNSSDPFSRN